MEPVTTTFALATLLGASSMNRAHRGEFISFGHMMPQSTLVFDSVFERHVHRVPASSYNARSEAIASLWHMRSLENGWDGETGIAPTEVAISTAEVFINALPFGILTPRVGLANDGEIGLFWDVDGHFADIGFSADGSFGYYAAGPDGREASAEGLTFEMIPHELIELLPEATSKVAEAA